MRQACDVKIETISLSIRERGRKVARNLEFSTGQGKKGISPNGRGSGIPNGFLGEKKEKRMLA